MAKEGKNGAGFSGAYGGKKSKGKIKDVTYTESKTVNTGSKYAARRKANAAARRKKLGIKS